MKSFGGLFERIVDPSNLELAARRAARGKHCRVPVRQFLENLPREVEALNRELVAGIYRPRPYTQFRIMDPKPRLISCADFRDRVVHHAVCGIVAPLMERRFVCESYACRAGKGSHRAVLHAQSLVRRFPYVWKGDIERFYDNVDHETLVGMIDRLVREDRVRELVRVLVEHPFPGQAPGKGLPIGNLTSQWLANFYLDRFDHFVKEVVRAPGYVRYMDDFAAWHLSKGKLFEVWAAAREFLRDSLRLKLKAPVTRVQPSAEGLPFLGFRVFPGTLRLLPGRRRRMRRLIRQRERQWANGEFDDGKLAQCVGSSVGLLSFFGIRGLNISTLEV